MEALPQRVDTLIIGGGTTGAALAGLLAERSGESILVLEAGPDFGAYADGGWPRDVLDATWLAESHQRGYAADDGYRGRRIEFPRAAMIGGCSSHNGCAAIWGSRLDYDALAAAACRAGRARRSSRCCGRRASACACASRRRPSWRRSIAPPWRRSWPSACRACTTSTTSTSDTGVAPSPVNIAGGVRWNAALAYLDPVRGRAVPAHLRRRARRAPARAGRAGARRRRAARGRARQRRGRARDRVRGRLRLPRAAAALRHRARRRPAGARHPRRRPTCPASARTCTITPRSSSASPARPSCRLPAATTRRAARSPRSRA